MGNMWLVAAIALCAVSMFKLRMCKNLEETGDVMRLNALDECKRLKCAEVKETNMCQKCDLQKSLPGSGCKGPHCEEERAMQIKEETLCKEGRCEKVPDGLASLGEGNGRLNFIPKNRPRLIVEGELLLQRVSRHEISPAEKEAMLQAWEEMQNEIETRSASYEGQQEFETEAFGNGRRVRMEARMDAVYCSWETEACKPGNRIDAATLLDDFKDLWEQTNAYLKGEILDQNSVFAKSGRLQFFTQVADKIQSKKPESVRLTASELPKAQPNSTSENSLKLVPEGEVFVQRVSWHEITPSEKDAMSKAWERVRNDAKTEGKKVFEGKEFDHGSRARIVVEVAGNQMDAAKLVGYLEDLWNRTNTKEKIDIVEHNSVFMQSGHVQIFTQVARKVQPDDSNHT